MTVNEATEAKVSLTEGDLEPFDLDNLVKNLFLKSPENIFKTIQTWGLELLMRIDLTKLIENCHQKVFIYVLSKFPDFTHIKNLPELV